ncbi:unnamed protein product [Paramecium primaurelia]|uniref:Uncharacterized protein n=2 Tax=Paramecium TaxID=5884 RepID=A0A8S1UV47_9CILI|nr:unnamed protein product [Paramecium primaurelia]CAD8168123.1 unnamed protein product [Paramecium pentaurelia]
MNNKNDQVFKEPPPYYFFGIPLHNKRVAQQFCFIFILVLIIPFSMFFGLRESLGEVSAGISAVVSIQFVIAYYVIMIIRDPENFPNADKARKQIEQRKQQTKQNQVETEPIKQSGQKKDNQSQKNKLKQN